ncbi:MAG: IS630 family transposase [Proteobacteria bacterium]|nr:IS630 family transposase [Pseudomonadota bacterium]
MRVAKPVELSADDDRRLRILSKRKRVEARVQMRARVVLLAAAGMSDKGIAEELDTDRRVAARWRARFLADGVDGLLHDASRPGRPRTARKVANVEQVVRITLEETPADATHWSTRTLAAHLGISASAVGRIWRAHGLKPHRVKSFKLSNDPRFIEKLEDIVGLYLDPPEHALVLCCDEKTQIQALDRTQPGLPLKRGRGKTMTHDYKRNGVTTLFAALDMLTGKVLSMTDQLHRHQEWLQFLKTIDRKTPKTKELHLIVDNYATHKHPEVVAWLAKHPRFHMHFTPTSSSWLNMVERFFRDITDKRIRRGVFASVPELEAAINDYIATHNANPKPFIWTAKASDILAKVTRARAVLNKRSSN